MMRLSGFAWLSGVAVLLLGCQTKVIGGGGGNGGNDGMTTGTSSSTGDTVSSSGTGAPPTDDGPAIAMLRSELPATTTQDGSAAVTTTGGGGEDPKALFLFISNTAQSCGDPFGAVSGCAKPQYQVAITLSTALQAVGTYSLDQLATAGVAEPEGGGICSGGGGSYFDGTIAITAIDATHVDFTLAGTADLLNAAGSNANGSYTAKRCF